MVILARKIGDERWIVIFRGAKEDGDRIFRAPAAPTLEFSIIEWEE